MFIRLCILFIILCLDNCPHRLSRTWFSALFEKGARSKWCRHYFSVIKFNRLYYLSYSSITAFEAHSNQSWINLFLIDTIDNRRWSSNSISSKLARFQLYKGYSLKKVWIGMNNIVTRVLSKFRILNESSVQIKNIHKTASRIFKQFRYSY